MPTQTAVLHPILAALVKAEVEIGPNRIWTATNDQQRIFLENFFTHRGDLSQFSPEELKSWMSWRAEELNQILQQEGFAIQLQPFKPNEFGVVGILDLLMEWLQEGKKKQIFAQNQRQYPGVNIKSGIGQLLGSNDAVPNFSAFTHSSHQHPIVAVQTKTGDIVWMTIADKEREGFDLMTKVMSFKRNDLQPMRSKEFVEFPMIDLEQEVNIEWLLNMTTMDAARNVEVYISQAMQQTKFKMNHKGAHLKSAVAMGMTRKGISMEDGVTIDAPFYLWVERNGLQFPIMAAYMDYDVMKDPGGLDM